MALLGIFKPMLPVIRTRAKDLLDVIRASLKDSLVSIEVLQPSIKAIHNEQDSNAIISTSSAVDSSAKDHVKDLSQKIQYSARLWSIDYNCELAMSI